MKNRGRIEYYAPVEPVWAWFRSVKCTPNPSTSAASCQLIATGSKTVSARLHTIFYANRSAAPFPGGINEPTQNGGIKSRPACSPSIVCVCVCVCVCKEMENEKPHTQHTRSHQQSVNSGAVDTRAARTLKAACRQLAQPKPTI